MRFVLLVLLAVLCWTPSAYCMDAANELQGSCEQFLRAYRPSGNQGFSLQASSPGVWECWGFITGLQQLTVVADEQHRGRLLGVCTPPESTGVQLVRVVVTYLQRHPENLHRSAGVMALAALQETFPCQQ
ncbi:Rap1a/Tai family immunity protein [Bradyrhizobium sp. 187]|uniref:Rap1a/Tai family immunity protein n=1 Tax=Bradyrhizobium sp. 187 TaxID=2782655 RepID=UPI001FFE4682|nr:Rap1a/Tai family immunity protein [Bradyrhizobium sp. 187]UPJ72982.1 hypothetical protein IVB19_36580 [Bradyrhizobium sp. 187]